MKQLELAFARMRKVLLSSLLVPVRDRSIFVFVMNVVGSARLLLRAALVPSLSTNLGWTRREMIVNQNQSVHGQPSIRYGRISF
jgi:hypothetical protein